MQITWKNRALISYLQVNCLESTQVCIYVVIKVTQVNFHFKLKLLKSRKFLSKVGKVAFLYTKYIPKAYIPPQCEPLHARASRWEIPPTRDFRVANTNIVVSKKPGRPNAKLGGPNTSRWNIVRFKYAMVWFALGMLISCCLCQFR